MSAYKRGEEYDRQMIALYRSSALIKAGFKIEGELFGVPNPKEEDVELQLSATRLQFVRLEREQEPFLRAAQECFDLVVRLSMKGEKAEFLRSCASVLAQCREAGSVHYPELRRLLASIESLVGPLQDPRFAGQVLPQLEELTTALADLLARMRALFAGLDFPFQHWKGKMFLQDYLSAKPDEDALRIFQVHHDAEIFTMRYQMLYFRLVAAFIEEASAFEHLS